MSAFMNSKSPRKSKLPFTVVFMSLFVFCNMSMQAQKLDSLFKNIEMRFDTVVINYGEYRIKEQPHFFFPIENGDQEVEIRWYPKKQIRNKPVGIIEAKHYEQTDSILMIGDSHYRVRLKLKDVKVGQAFSVLVAVEVEQKRQNFELFFYPYVEPKIGLAETDIELFRGEEKSIDVVSPHQEFIQIDEEWVETENYDYWLRRTGGELQLMVRGKTTGNVKLIVPVSLSFFHPKNGTITKSTHGLQAELNIKPSRLRFLNVDRENVFFDSESRTAGEMQIDYHPRFQMKQMYRVEDANENAGRLVAEIIPKSTLGNDKVLCEVYSYSHHRISDGYLYIKDGNRTFAMTNFNVVNRPQIQSIELMREGGDWTENLNVFPGETVELRIRGNGLSISKFNFTPCEQQRDTTRVSDRIVFYTVSVPVDIDYKKVSIFFNEDVTAYELIVREYSRPAPLNFISLDYNGKERYPITSEKMRKPVFVRETIEDITILFNRSEIDKASRLHGRQNLEVEVRILSNENQLLDIQTIRNIEICPDSTSPRARAYAKTNCERYRLSLNSHLLRKTFALEAFDQIVIEVRHSSGNGPSERIHLYANRRYSFDVDVSFPAGLLVVRADEPNVGNFTGVSTAFMAQFKFYSQKRIGQLTPFQIGAGFLALNAFNFSENVERDLGVVVLASIVPVRRKNSFSVPIYLGAGYLINESQFMVLFGPGLQIRF
jgi:hypothetical protein